MFQFVAFLIDRRKLVSELLADEFYQGLAYERRFARARYAGDRRKHAERQRDIEVAEVIARDAGEMQPALRLARRANQMWARPEQVTASLRTLDARQPSRWAAVQDVATVSPAPGPTSTIQSA